MAHYSDSVYQLSHEKAKELILVIFIISVLMLIGLIGNPLVVYFYGFRMKATASYMFIVVLAVCDIIICAVSMPLEIVDIVEFYSFENGSACKVFRFVNYFAALASGLTLIAIAVDRFRKICRPFDGQITVYMAKWVILICFGVSGLLSWPSAVFYDVVQVNITEDPDIVGYDCTTIRDNNYKLLITIYNILLFFLFLITMVSLIVLYCLVGRQLFQLKKFRFFTTRRKPSECTSPVTSQTSPSDTGISECKKSYSVSDEKRSSDMYEATSDTGNCYNNISFTAIENENEMDKKVSKKTSVVSKQNYDIYEMRKEPQNQMAEKDSDGINDPISCENPSSNNQQSPGKNPARKKHSAGSSNMQQHNINTRKYTIITISITAAFIVSFLPHLILVTWRTLAKDYEVNILSGPGMVAFQLFIRSHLISSACNPVIYGFLNTEFKNMIMNKLRSLCCYCCGRKDRDVNRKTSSAGSS